MIAMLCDAAWKANLQLHADGNPHAGPFRRPFALHFVFLLSEAERVKVLGGRRTPDPVALRAYRIPLSLSPIDYHAARDR
ncbi:hypothetical protein [Actinoplanes aureus]|uniref:Uncharacterized protein n=1 Tax=Actinoplanes aureus TaxID=2792083 RepID=A0A931G3C2_9ACTN|nr:hypothetical protein [Actinoplanes aureus]MBG0568692.1 hypothetical protein [Actinoplanes aureus]